MNAKQLAEIVGTQAEPSKPWWPDGLTYEPAPDADSLDFWSVDMDGMESVEDSEGEAWKGEEPKEIASILPPQTAELVFIGSMARWLFNEGLLPHSMDVQTLYASCAKARRKA